MARRAGIGSNWAKNGTGPWIGAMGLMCCLLPGPSQGTTLHYTRYFIVRLGASQKLLDGRAMIDAKPFCHLLPRDGENRFATGTAFWRLILVRRQEGLRKSHKSWHPSNVYSQVKKANSLVRAFSDVAFFASSRLAEGRRSDDGFAPYR